MWVQKMIERATDAELAWQGWVRWSVCGWFGKGLSRSADAKGLWLA